jgi:hypothetical protein
MLFIFLSLLYILFDGDLKDRVMNERWECKTGHVKRRALVGEVECKGRGI